MPADFFQCSVELAAEWTALKDEVQWPSQLVFRSISLIFEHATSMALSKQLVAAKRQRTALPNSVKRRVILQDDHDPALPDNAPARPRLDDQQRVLAGQQSLVLSPPRLSTVFDSNDIDAARTDIASLKDKVPVGEEEVGRLVTVIGHNQHGTCTIPHALQQVSPQPFQYGCWPTFSLLLRLSHKLSLN